MIQWRCYFCIVNISQFRARLLSDVLGGLIFFSGSSLAFLPVLLGTVKHLQNILHYSKYYNHLLIPSLAPLLIIVQLLLSDNLLVFLLEVICSFSFVSVWTCLILIEVAIVFMPLSFVSKLQTSCILFWISVILVSLSVFLYFILNSCGFCIQSSFGSQIIDIKYFGFNLCLIFFIESSSSN